MKILLISEFFPIGKNLKFSGGVEARTFFLAKNLAKRHEVYVLTSWLSGSKRKETMFNFTVFRVGPKRKYNPTVGDIFDRLGFIRDAISVGKTLDLDIADGSNFITHFIAKRIAQHNNIPAVSWYPDVWIKSWIKNVGIFGIFGEILERLNLTFGFNAYIAISGQTAKKLKLYVKDKITVIPCGVDQKEFATPAKKFENPTVICISRLTKYKNLKTLILAFAHLTTKLPNVRLIIVGSGPDHNNLKDLTKALKINSKIRFLSNLSRKELTQLIKSSHIFSLPSLVEGFGISTVESACAGLPYVISNIEVHQEITKSGQGGFLIDPSDPLLFSERFYELFNNKSLYIHKSKRAKELAKIYDWNAIAQETEKVYLSLGKNHKHKKI